jgi:hypothetical protein
MVSALQVMAGRPGWLEPDWVVYGMRTQRKKTVQRSAHGRGGDSECRTYSSARCWMWPGA